MDQPFNRISDNVLFTLLLVALVGCLAAPVATNLLSDSAGEARHAAVAGVHRS
jgi:hypothetical protein